MNKKLLFSGLIIFTLLASVTFLSCGGSDSTTAAAPKSDGTKDLNIDFQLNLAAADADNFFTFKGPIRYMAVEMDQPDSVTGASKLGSTHLFQSYLYDVEGKYTMSGGLRGLFLFATNPFTQIATDNLNASKAADGTITIQYAHRGTAYQITTDKKGNLAFPDGAFRKRAIGYIKSGAPQVISTDFSSDKTSATVDWAKAWNANVKSGTVVTEGVDKKTGDIAANGADPKSMYFFDGTLNVTLVNNILKIDGFLTAVKR